MELNYIRVAQEALKGERAIDEQALESMAVLSERLERIRSLGGKFANIGFSAAAKKLSKTRMTVSV